MDGLQASPVGGLSGRQRETLEPNLLRVPRKIQHGTQPVASRISESTFLCRIIDDGAPHIGRAHGVDVAHSDGASGLRQSLRPGETCGVAQVHVACRGHLHSMLFRWVLQDCIEVLHTQGEASGRGIHLFSKMFTHPSWSDDTWLFSATCREFDRTMRCLQCCGSECRTRHSLGEVSCGAHRPHLSREENAERAEDASHHLLARMTQTVEGTCIRLLGATLQVGPGQWRARRNPNNMSGCLTLALEHMSHKGTHLRKDAHVAHRCFPF